MGEKRHPSEERLWTLAFQKLSALDARWNEQEALAVQAWMRGTGLPRLVRLADLIRPQMVREDFWHILVPVEREVKHHKPTDITILDSDSLLPAATTRLPVSLVLDSLRSAMNVGGIFRTAECFALKEILLTGYTPDPQSDPRVAAAALGTQGATPWRRFPTLREAIATLRSEGLAIIAAETVADAPAPSGYPWSLPCAIILGSERFGLAPEDIGQCDAVVRIPMFGAKNSLNVVSAAAVLAYELRRRFPDAQPYAPTR